MSIMDLYHLLNRGVDARTIFYDTQDYARFVHDMYEFNDTRPVYNVGRDFMIDIVSQSSEQHAGEERKKKKLVDIHGWCLMKNHYHLLVSERGEGGITQFLRRLNIGYAKYFNEKYKRSGTLFQGRTKKILIERDAHFLFILHYIHLNPLDYMREAKTWRERHVPSATRALAYLSGYKWSSYRDYCGEKNFPSILNTKLFRGAFGDYKKELASYLKDMDTGSELVTAWE
jgi:putative transposase